MLFTRYYDKQRKTTTLTVKYEKPEEKDIAKKSLELQAGVSFIPNTVDAFHVDIGNFGCAVSRKEGCVQCGSAGMYILELQREMRPHKIIRRIGV